jgi:hypothetical protein
MGGVCNKLSHLLFTLETGSKSLIHVVQHQVQRSPHLPSLAIRVRILGRDAQGQANITPVEWLLRHRGCGFGNAIQRLERITDQDCPNTGRQHHHNHHDGNNGNVQAGNSDANFLQRETHHNLRLFDGGNQECPVFPSTLEKSDNFWFAPRPLHRPQISYLVCL